jgi:CDP-paratose 2-epimerase
LAEDNRIGDHRWWISDLEPFKHDHPGWDLTYGIDDILVEIRDHNIELWTARTSTR